MLEEEEELEDFYDAYSGSFVVDLNGREVLATVSKDNAGTLQWDITGLPGGVYLLYGIQDGHITDAQRLVIMR